MKPPLEYYDALRVTETGPWGRELDGSFSCEVRVFLRATDSIGLAAQVPGIDCGEDGSFEIGRKARLPGAVFLESWKTGSQMGLDQLKAKEIHLVVAAMARAIMQIRSHCETCGITIAFVARKDLAQDPGVDATEDGGASD